METFCIVIFNLWVWGLKFKHSNNGQNFSSKMSLWVTGPGSQRTCRWEKSDSTARLQRKRDSHAFSYPTSGSGGTFSRGGWATFVNSLHNISTPERWATTDRTAPNWSFQIGGSDAFFCWERYFQVASRVCSITLIQKKCNTVWELWVYQRAWETQKFCRVSKPTYFKHGGPLPFSFKISTN